MIYSLSIYSILIEGHLIFFDSFFFSLSHSLIKEASGIDFILDPYVKDTSPEITGPKNHLKSPDTTLCPAFGAIF